VISVSYPTNRMTEEQKLMTMRGNNIHFCRYRCGSGKMTNRTFHDAVLEENAIPIEMVRASLTRLKLSRDFVSSWKFYGEKPHDGL
jgi:hypothetical protein